VKRPIKICNQCRKPKKEGCKQCAPKPFANISRQNQHFYNSTRWRKISKGYKEKHPLCVECLKKGITKQSEVTDHIIPIDKGGDKFNSDNLQALCHRCHNSKTGKSR